MHGYAYCMTAKNRGLAGGSLAAESTEAGKGRGNVCRAGASVIDMDCGLRQALHFKGLSDAVATCFHSALAAFAGLAGVGFRRTFA